MKLITAKYWNETWNPIVGCPGPKVSPGCANCWAEGMADRFHNHEHEKLIFRPEFLAVPLRWKRARRVFVCNTSDLFHNHVKYEEIDAVLETIETADKHLFLLCTKRVKNLEWKLYGTDGGWYKRRLAPGDNLPDNALLGVSCCNQKEFDENLPLLDRMPGNSYDHISSKTWLSLEPLLGPIDLSAWIHLPKWVVVGCESGPERRPCKLAWVERIVDQCRAARVPVWVKQLDIDGECVREMGRFPQHLRIRELPIVALKEGL